MFYVRENNKVIKKTQEEYDVIVNLVETIEQTQQRAIALKAQVDAGTALELDVSDLQTQLDAVLAELA